MKKLMNYLLGVQFITISELGRYCVDKNNIAI